ncbi:MAG: GNAT family N-acyltransferase [Burkholderiales bacterium]
MPTSVPSPATAPDRAQYRLRLADSPADLRAAQRLRFEVFNLELDEGLAASYDTGLDADEFDAACDHLVVEDCRSGDVIGTYRLQTGTRAAIAPGYYCAREFDLAPFESERARIGELGRACIAVRHRNFTVLNLLWRGIADWAGDRGVRYLIGCSSFTAQDERIGAAAWRTLQPALAPPAWRTSPVAAHRCAIDDPAPGGVAIPRLLGAYLALGAKVCGPPAIDREFRTIDVLTWLDLASPRVAALRGRGRIAATAPRDAGSDDADLTVSAYTPAVPRSC